MTTTTTRTCARPGCPAPLGPRQTAYCSRACSLGANAPAPRKLALPDRHCPACGKVLVRREKERASDFRARQSCGAECNRRRRAEGAAASPRRVAPVVVVAPPNRPTWRPAGWPAEVPAELLQHRGAAV